MKDYNSNDKNKDIITVDYIVTGGTLDSNYLRLNVIRLEGPNYVSMILNSATIYTKIETETQRLNVVL